MGQDEDTGNLVRLPPDTADAIDQAKLLAELKANMFGRPKKEFHLGRYTLGKKIAEGGFGIIYEAFDPQLDRKVAIKLLHGREKNGPPLIDEARALAKVRHPNVVLIHDVGEYDGHEVFGDEHAGSGVFIVMALVDGVDARRWMTSSPTVGQIVRAFADAGRGLQAAHDNRVVHCDVKPANILIADVGVQVVDFGLAHAEGRLGSTPSGAGSPAYMSPEQQRGEAVGPTTDQFALCAALYEALYGSLPFDPRDAQVRLQLIARGPEFPDRNDIPVHVRDTLARGLAADPKDRFPTMSTLVASLLGEDEDHVADARKERTFTGPRGQLEIWKERPTIVMIVVTGHLHAEHGYEAVRWVETQMASSIDLFCDWRNMSGYDTQARNAMTASILRNFSMFRSVHILTTATFVRMGVSVANLALGGHLNVYAEPEPFEAAFAESVAANDNPT